MCCDVGVPVGSHFSDSALRAGSERTPDSMYHEWNEKVLSAYGIVENMIIMTIKVCYALTM